MGVKSFIKLDGRKKVIELIQEDNGKRIVKKIKVMKPKKTMAWQYHKERFDKLRHFIFWFPCTIGLHKKENLKNEQWNYFCVNCFQWFI